MVEASGSIRRTSPRLYTRNIAFRLTQLYHSKIASEYDQKFPAAVAQLEQQLEAKKGLIGIKQGDRFLDYACGTGMLSKACYTLS